MERFLTNKLPLTIFFGSVLLMCTILLVFAGSVSAQSFFANPHGPYDAQTSGCAACHVAHAGMGPQLLSHADITGVCLSCHDGTASIYDVAAVYEPYGENSRNTSFHPVVGTGNPDVGEIIECADCHNPHGQNPKLLRSSDGQNRYWQGPAFCLACHGSERRSFLRDQDGEYWYRTAGNHLNSNSPAHYNVNSPYLQPQSGTQVTCIFCHQPHAGSKDNLLEMVEEDLCKSCHMTPQYVNSRGHPIRYFNRTGSIHNLDRSGVAQLGCTSCHGPHTVSSVDSIYRTSGGPGCISCHRSYYGRFYAPYILEGSKSVISDPHNTKANFAAQAGTGLGGTPNTIGDLSDFCLRCHGGSPPQAVKTAEAFVPYTVVFPTVHYTTNSGGWNKSGYKETSHGISGLKITCGDCHESHGANFAALARHDEDTTTQNRMCLRCHNGSTTEKNIRADIIKPYRHPTLTITGKHSNTESYSDMSLAERHAECADCHDPHQATGASAISPLAGGPLAGVSGVRVDFSDATWGEWPEKVSYEPIKEIEYQYELCFKCHSDYSYGETPPDSPSRIATGRATGKQTNTAREFNPNNDSYHPVVGASKVPTYFYDEQEIVYGRLNQNWERAGEWVDFVEINGNSAQVPAAGRAAARLYCTDCHGSDNGTSFGPHGSVNPFILIAPWRPGFTGIGAPARGKPPNPLYKSDDHLCFVCHDYDFYTGYSFAMGTGEVRSKYSGDALVRLAPGENPVVVPIMNHHYHGGSSSYYNPITNGAGCASCHAAVPHGWMRRSLLAGRGEEAPYSEKSKLKTALTLPNPGQWYLSVSSGCQHCH